MPALAVAAACTTPAPTAGPDGSAAADQRLGVTQSAGAVFVVCTECPGPTPKTPIGSLAAAPKITVKNNKTRKDPPTSVTRIGRRAPDSKPPAGEPAFVVHFRFGESVVRPRELKALRRFAEDLDYRRGVRVAGYTDDIGPQAYNDALARRRAEAVARVLGELGIRPRSVQGWGKCCYVAPNDTRENRAKNRRAEIHFTTRKEE